MAVTDEAILKIKEMIISGEFGPGDRLPPEKELSEALGLSRSSMREAIKALEVIRVLDVRRGDGTYVTSLEPRLLLEAMSFVVDLHADSSILEFFAVRRILEPAAVALAAARMSPTTLADLRAQLDSVDTTTTVDELIEHDLAFHSAIVAEAGNAYLASLIESLSSHTVRARMWRALTQRNAVDRTLAEHRAILDALERGDAELAQALTTVHISGVEQWLHDGVRLAARGVHLGAGTG
ncbi:MAG: GntR family transcriptional regulator, transcriptional repressor for pyruvate dehydrogenase complex [Microbacteriaceae bacterium]|jgi:GntR family transcriptional repressor for pyruvate dehydrogenase complex|nr:GntR family transcriptional regulator, transcriptional repressor for pyruvate dehydrogenase complex [Microbacteriaceae bacterium]